MNYDYYRVFLSVGKHHSFTRAAEELYTSQPAVTRTIKNLETELGVKLFVRSKKGVEFTLEGERLYEGASAAFALLNKTEEELSASLSLQAGSVALGATITALDEFLFDFLESFRKDYPGIKIRISTHSSDQTIAKLRQGKIDIAFVTTPYRYSEDLIAFTISSFENIVIAGHGYPELRKGKHDIASLSKYPLVYLSSAMQLREYCDDIFRAHGVSVTPSIELDSASTIAPMVAKNFGIGIVPKSLVRDALEKDEVFEVQTIEPLPSREVVMLKSASYPETAPAKAFFLSAKEHSKNHR